MAGNWNIDPDQTLAEIRTIITKAPTLADIAKLLDLVTLLDASLSSGGKLPKQWSRTWGQK